MKRQNLIFALFVVCLFCNSCSSSDNIDEQLTICVVVKVLETDLPIINTRISFYGRLSCYIGGCGYSQIGDGITDNMGEVCVTLSRLDFKDIELIACTWNDTYYEGSFDFSPSISVIYVDTIF